MFTVVSFNINGLRARLHQLSALIEKHNPDVIGLQETKVHDDVFPKEAVSEMGYEVYYHGGKAHYGVALLCKKPAEAIIKGLPQDTEETQRRLITTDVLSESGAKITIINGYFPQGESRDHPTKFPMKEAFYANLNQRLKDAYSPEDYLVVMGDFNISHQDIDIGIGAQNAKRWLRTGKCSFLPEERDWFNKMLSWGLIDTYRATHPDKDDTFSWFDYRSRGFEQDPKHGLRIDTVLASTSLNTRLVKVGIDYEIRSMEKPSDHCPVWATFDL